MTELAQAVRNAVGRQANRDVWRPDKRTEENFWRLFGGAKERSQYGDHRYHSWDVGLSKMMIQQVKESGTTNPDDSKEYWTLDKVLRQVEPKLMKEVKYGYITKQQALARLEAIKLWWSEV